MALAGQKREKKMENGKEKSKHFSVSFRYVD